MTAKDYVKRKYPFAVHEKFGTYYLILTDYSIRGGNLLSRGDTLKQAWTNAKNKLESSQQPK